MFRCGKLSTHIRARHPLRYRGGHDAVGAYPRCVREGYATMVACLLRSLSGHAVVAACPLCSLSGYADIVACPLRSLGGHAEVIACPPCVCSGYADIVACPLRFLRGYGPIGYRIYGCIDRNYSGSLSSLVYWSVVL